MQLEKNVISLEESNRKFKEFNSDNQNLLADLMKKEMLDLEQYNQYETNLKKVNEIQDSGSIIKDVDFDQLQKLQYENEDFKTEIEKSATRMFTKLETVQKHTKVDMADKNIHC